jgi:hypothetical protein
MITKPATIDELLDYWPGNIPFKEKLVNDDGSCMCAQGQALHFLGGLTVDELRNINQRDADRQVAKLFSISLAHSILLRNINDNREGAPSCVIRNPEQVLGDQSQVVLAFWRHLDRMTPADKEAAWAAARAGALPWTAARAAAKAAAGEAARGASLLWPAAGATSEIQGASFIRANNQPFVFLPLFGFSNPKSVIASSI